MYYEEITVFHFERIYLSLLPTYKYSIFYDPIPTFRDRNSLNELTYPFITTHNNKYIINKIPI